MTEEQARTETVDLLQDLGLKEYEARCFLALTQASTATAKDISEMSEVPRTRVYDAIRVLEAEGLVQVQHTSPQQFRAVDVDEAAATLRRKYDDRLDALESHLERFEEQGDVEDLSELHEVWSLTGHAGIETRTVDMVEEATDEILLVTVDESLLTDELFAALNGAVERDVDVILGGLTASVIDSVGAAVPGASVFETELPWLEGSADDDVAIGRFLLADRETLLVSSYYEEGEDGSEQAVFATGLGNGLVVLIRRLLATGLLDVDDPRS